ncbi:50S ribosomal protein L15 [Candidatus Woesearchaeota archaeon]|nr:MAG: 50S ribosomal protein L15 [Candidatus Woesearchaeota archaeon]
MVKFKRKKVVKMRGSKTHGGGSMKKRRGAGNRGGRGNAGSGKRGDSKKQTFQIKGIKPGKRGFKKKGIQKPVIGINVGELERILPLWIESGKVKGNDVNLSQLGFGKLLGSGSITKALTITVGAATERAIAKVEKAGGKVVLPDQEESNEESPAADAQEE